jgi:8-oxo-dGTP diphosphatase
MNLNNPRYQNQGIHTDVVVFTVENREVKILLVKRGKEPFTGQWILPGGAVYNNESVEQAAKRELIEKTGLKDLYLEQFNTFSDPNRDPRLRMISVAYLALIDKNKVSILQKTSKTMDAAWFAIDDLPKLAFDHNKIVKMAVAVLRKRLMDTNIAFAMMEPKFTLPDLQNLYEIILDQKFDRRNFRRKFINLGLIESTGDKKDGASNRPAILYEFQNKRYEEVEVM